MRAYSACPTTMFPAPNSATGSGVPSCSPPLALSPFELDDRKGRCDFRMRTELSKPCVNGGPDACLALRIDAKCSGILEPDGATPSEQAGWMLDLRVRATIDDPDNGDMTVVDLAMTIDLPPAEAGSCGSPEDEARSPVPAGRRCLHGTNDPDTVLAASLLSCLSAVAETSIL